MKVFKYSDRLFKYSTGSQNISSRNNIKLVSLDYETVNGDDFENVKKVKLEE